MDRPQSYSATVKASLHVNGEVLNIAQVGPDFCIVRDPRELPPSEAIVMVSIDGIERSRRVYLTNSVSSESKEVRFAVMKSQDVEVA